MKNHAHKISIVCDICHKFLIEKKLKVIHLVINNHQQDPLIPPISRYCLDLECLMTQSERSLLTISRTIYSINTIFIKNQRERCEEAIYIYNACNWTREVRMKDISKNPNPICVFSSIPPILPIDLQYFSLSWGLQGNSSWCRGCLHPFRSTKEQFHHTSEKDIHHLSYNSRNFSPFLY